MIQTEIKFITTYLIHINIIISCIRMVIMSNTSSWTTNKKTLVHICANISIKGPQRTFYCHGYMRKQKKAVSMAQDHKWCSKWAILYNCSLQVRGAPLNGLWGEESVCYARVSRCIVIVRGLGGREGGGLQHSDGLLFDDAGCASWGGIMGGSAWCGGIGSGCAMCIGTTKKGVAGSNKGLNKGTAKAHQKNT